VAVATSVFVPGIAATAGSVVHSFAPTPVWFVAARHIPGVPLGGTVGTRIGKYLPSDLMGRALGVVFAAVGLIVLGSELLV
jgi:uncharacterized membrane protein YfcA